MLVVRRSFTASCPPRAMRSAMIRRGRRGRRRPRSSDRRVCPPGTPASHQKTAHAGGSIVAGVAQAVLDRVTEAGNGAQRQLSDRRRRSGTPGNPCARSQVLVISAEGSGRAVTIEMFSAPTSAIARRRNSAACRIRLQLGGWAIRAVDPVAHLIRPIQKQAPN